MGVVRALRTAGEHVVVGAILVFWAVMAANIAAGLVVLPLWLAAGVATGALIEDGWLAERTWDLQVVGAAWLVLALGFLGYFAERVMGD